MSTKPYENALVSVKNKLKRDLASGGFSIDTLAITRVSISSMSDQLVTAPGSVEVFDSLKDPVTGVIGPEHWKLHHWRTADRFLFPHLIDESTSAAYRKKFLEHLEFGLSMRTRLRRGTSVEVDRQNGKRFLISDNPEAQKIMDFVTSEFPPWFGNHAMDSRFLAQSSAAAFSDFLNERPEMLALIRISQSLPPDVEVDDVPVDRPAMVSAASTLIALIPVVGNMVAAYEAYAGKDIFGFRLTDLERGILAASVLLPIAGRLFKLGRAAYTEARLVSLYGRDAATWSRAVQNGTSATLLSTERAAIRESEAFVRAQNKLGEALAKKANAGIKTILNDTPGTITKADAAISALFNQLSSKHPFLSKLDELSLQRIAEKGTNPDHLKGQILEELLETDIVSRLGKARIGEALGISTGLKKLEFIPGHMIRGLDGRQITDGILAIRTNGSIEIVAVFEAKAGKFAARELSLTRQSLSSLSEAEKLELQAYAKDCLREQREIAKAQGTPFTKTLDDIKDEIKLNELGGQIRRDIERLSKDNSLIVGRERVPIRFSPNKTKFFGVLPKDVNSSLIERELKSENVNFEILGIDVTQKQLKDLADSIKTIATNLAKKATP